MTADLRLALRQRRKAPGFSVTAVLTLALAIGANAVVFSVLNALVLRPLKVQHPESLFMVERNFGQRSAPSQSYMDYLDLRDRSRSFDSLISYDITGSVGLDTGSGNPSVVWPYMVSGNYFDALGIQPYLGRLIHASDEHGKNSAPYIVLSYAYWKSHFNAQQFNVSPDYFRAAGTKLLDGRTFTLHDEKDAPMVAVVNREFARKVFGKVENAVGSHYKVWSGTRVEIIGIVEDGKYETLTEDAEPAMFYSFLQQPSNDARIVVRSNRDTPELAAALQRSIHSLDPALPLSIKTWNSELDSALFAARVATVALGAMGLLGAMLAITGIFGMASYAVSKRLRELGIRVALGANRTKVLKAALGPAFRLLAIGSIAGMVLGLLATRVLSFIVYQATPKDPVVLVGVIFTMLAVGLVASWIPARHALAVDPMILLPRRMRG